MAFGVFIHRSDSIYDDSPAERYQFPSQYLSRAEACADDWIVYLEPSKVAATRGYFAIAKVQQIIPDPGAPDMYLALIEPGSYLDFPNSVPFRGPGGVIERGLLNTDGKISGRAQAAVRGISPEDFNRITAAGLGQDRPLLPRTGDQDQHSMVLPDPMPVPGDQVRNRVASLSARLVRDQIFRQVVLRAYDERCAITGIKLINGSGRAEVEAAHIRPVAANGPDIINNGIALSGTAHWMFDRGLVSLDDDLSILISRHVNDSDAVRAIIYKTGRALPPRRLSDRPHPNFLRWHRENCFKHG